MSAPIYLCILIRTSAGLCGQDGLEPLRYMSANNVRQGVDIAGREICAMGARQDVDAVAARIGRPKYLFGCIDLTIGVEIAARPEKEQCATGIMRETPLFHQDGQRDGAAPPHQRQPRFAHDKAALAISAQEQGSFRRYGHDLIGIKLSKPCKIVGAIFDGKMAGAHSEHSGRIA